MTTRLNAETKQLLVEAKARKASKEELRNIFKVGLSIQTLQSRLESAETAKKLNDIVLQMTTLSNTVSRSTSQVAATAKKDDSGGTLAENMETIEQAVTDVYDYTGMSHPMTDDELDRELEMELDMMALEDKHKSPTGSGYTAPLVTQEPQKVTPKPPTRLEKIAREKFGLDA